MRRLGIALFALLILVPAPYASADLVFTTNIVVSGTGLGAVSTIVTAHATGQDTHESACINQNGSFTPCLGGVEGTDNVAINQVLTFTNDTSFAAVVNISETGQDLTVTLTDLYLTFCGTGGGGCHDAFYTGGDIDLSAGTGTGIGQSGFVFVLDAAQAAIVAGLGSSVTVSGGLEFEEGSTNDGSETLWVIQVPGQPVPEPTTLVLVGAGLAGIMLRRKNRK